MKATRFLVSGIVQGVGFRFFALRSARSLGVRGFARNLPDGRVEVVGTGSADGMRQFQEFLRRGPAGALVNGVTTSDAILEPAPEGFEIRP
jgi:acylphosphatase